MDKTLLVSMELEQGSQILRILDEAGLKIKVTLWVVLDEYGDWRLLLCSRRFDELGLGGAIDLVNRALATAGFPIEDKPPILILPMSDPFVRSLRHIFGKTSNVEGMRIGGQQIGNRWVEDGYAYRIS